VKKELGPKGEAFLLRDNLDENGGNRALKRRPVAQA
jgi:hypothetical protein